MINGTKSLALQTVTNDPETPVLPAHRHRDLLYIRNLGEAPMYVAFGEKHTNEAPNFGFDLQPMEFVSLMREDCPLGQVWLHTVGEQVTTTALVSYSAIAYPANYPG
jgi:hypothetical protein